MNGRGFSAFTIGQLGPSQIRRVKIMLEIGMSQRDIARRFGVSQPTISRIALGQKQI